MVKTILIEFYPGVERVTPMLFVLPFGTPKGVES